ncbi:MAG: hypothetical protein RSE35_02845, partial [Bacteroidales bacterium]
SFVYYLFFDIKVQMRHLYTFCWFSQLYVIYGDFISDIAFPELFQKQLKISAFETVLRILNNK